MLKQALEKLNAAQTNYCKTLSALIARDKEGALKAELEHKRGKLRGYLECLYDMGLITKTEMQSLYLWFFSEDRN